jgi:hypothetical protein
MPRKSKKTTTPKEHYVYTLELENGKSMLVELVTLKIE